MRNFCENCGARRKEGTDFCVQCGKPFTSAPAAPQAALSSERPCLVVTGGQANLLFADLSRGTVTIGRARSNTLVLNDSDVSRQHARVGFEDGEWVITDLNSRNGTFVNGEPVTRQTLRPGDQIRLGRTVLAFQSVPPAAPPHVKPSRLPPPERPAPTHARHSSCIVLSLAAAGLAILVLVAAGAAAVVWWNLPSDTSLKRTPLASQILQPSSEPQTVTAQDVVSVIVPGGLLTRPQTLTISEVENPPAIKSQEVFEPGRVYDISLGEQHEFDQPITIELKYDASKLSSEMSVDAQVRLAWWDPETETWSLLPTTVDETRQVAIARMNHLSVIGDRYLNAEGFRDYDPRMDRYDQFPHFRLIYDSRVSLRMELPERRPGTFDYQNRWVAVNTVEDYARYVGTEAERTYKIYLDKGLLEKNMEKGQEKTDIIVGDFRSIWGRQLDDETHPFGGAIFIRHDHGKLADLRHVVAHEMFHIVQLRKARFGAYASDRMFWFTEASAEYAACRIAWSDIPAQPGVPQPICQMGEGIKARFLRQTLEYRVTGSDTDPDNNHLYHASHFLDYLINGKPGVGTPKYGEDAARFNDIWGIMMLQLQARGEIDALAALRQWAGSFDFNEAFQDFAAYFLFNTNSPMPADPKNKVPNEALGDLTNGLLLTDTEIKSNPIQLPARYTAALWEVAVQIDPAKQSREVAVETEGALPVDVHLNVYQSGKDNQRADYGQWGGPEPVCHLSSKDVCTISVSEPQNLLNIVVVNASENQASVVVKVSAVQDEPMIRKTPSAGAGKCICEDGTPLTCDPEFEGWIDGFVLEVTLWEQSDLQWCYHDCLRECGCDPTDPDLSCAHKCICGE